MKHANITQENQNKLDQKVEEHPFELNMVMVVNDSTLQATERHLLWEQLVKFANSAMEHKRVSTSRHPWLLDSGASSHYVKDLSKFNT